MTAAAVLVAVGGYLLGGVLRDGPRFHADPWLWLFAPLAVMLPLALHEAGHVTAGLLCGFRFYLFIVGPLRVERDGERLRFSLNRLPSLWGGLAACVPSKATRSLRWRMLWYTAGGPLASLFGSAAVVLAASLRVSHPNLGIFCLIFGGVSFVVGLTTMIPVQLAGLASDGVRVLMLVRDQPEGRRWSAISALAGLSIAERPRHWPAELVEMMGDGLDASSDSVSVCLLRHLWHGDRGEVPSARVWLEQGLQNIETCAESMRGSYYLAVSYFEATQRGDAVRARQYLDLAAKPGLHKGEDLHLVRAAVLVAEGRVQEAVPELALAEASLESKSARIAAPFYEDIVRMRAVIE